MKPSVPAKVSLRNVRAATAASIKNERVTRARVDELMQWANVAGPAIEEAQKQIDATAHVVGQHMDFLQMGFIDRVLWFFTGQLPERDSSRVTKTL